ncbi:MAG TPA: sulfite exporter TauE/SafE family protein [Bryobacteraceae bacterium]|jgi:hypothetical protein|nr:sulfite exporter TauE/SafE family protein [Bryobacteraceae bacterium]
MVPIDFAHGAAAFAAAFLAGAINSVAGGGTLVSFPTLIWLGLDSVTANATSTVAIWPGTIGSLYGYRREIQKADRQHLLLVVPSLIGGIVGAILLRMTPTSIFDRMVPFLILFATLLFMAQASVQGRLGKGKAERHHSAKWLAGAMLFQLCVGLYGGYFGAGIGILMLAALGILGLKDIFEMQALKVLLGGVINGIAAVYFVIAGMVEWSYVLIMVAGSLAGGYFGAGAARKAGPTTVRRTVIGIGLAMAVYLFVKR